MKVFENLSCYGERDIPLVTKRGCGPRLFNISSAIIKEKLSTKIKNIITIKEGITLQKK
jgi:hypothetical protein